MIRHIVLDSWPLSSAAQPVPVGASAAVANWVQRCNAAGHQIYVAEVVDYEVRRELVRANKQSGIAQLNLLKSTLNYLPITTEAMLLAANLWAQARRGGYATGHPERLDVDVILAAQALLLPAPAGSVIVATTNVRHILRFVAADEWSNITP
jgi:predicted nucleic acid-binding protein